MSTETLMRSAAAVLALSLGGCGTTGAGSNSALLQAIVTDPKCAHHDEAEAIVGAAGLPASMHVKVVRDCPVQTQAAVTNPPAQP